MAERAIAQRSTSNQPGSTLRLVEPEAILSRVNDLNGAIARRAFELFEDEGRILGRDLDHWCKAESELLHPAHVQVRESGDSIVVNAEVPGFTANELQVSLEPHRVTITGQKQEKSDSKKGNVIYSERCSSDLLRTVELPVEVNAERATASLNNGMLELTVPKAAAAEPRSIPIQARSAGAS